MNHYLMAHDWHEHSDHAADGTPFGGPLCNCEQIARRAVRLGWVPSATSREIQDRLAEAERIKEPDRVDRLRVNSLRALAARGPKVVDGENATGKKRCPACGKVNYPFLHSCPLGGA